MFQKCNDIDSTLFLLTNYTKKRLWHNLNKNTEKTKHVEEKLHIDFFRGGRNQELGVCVKAPVTELETREREWHFG